jgi:signal transduction histidine kinase
MADADALARALWNLLENAVKYAGDSRTIQVEVSSREGLAAVAVRDEGIGIPRDEHKRIFDKFVRGAASVEHRIAGTGIGLAMVQHIARAHGGHVTVESEPGRGSTFTIWLPAGKLQTVNFKLRTSETAETETGFSRPAS